MSIVDVLFPWGAPREQALLTARREPVFGRERVYERVRYPNVYDCYAEAAKSPAFVGGAKVRPALQEGETASEMDCRIRE